MTDLATWQRIRRYAVPLRVIRECTAAREVGDWRAACAAAGIDVAFADAVIPPAVLEDLRAFAPDLLLWHLPRVLGGGTTLRPRETAWLSASTVPLSKRIPLLKLELPRTSGGSQRIRMLLATPPEESPLTGHDLAPGLWRVTHAEQLREQYTPWIAEDDDLIAAWALAGVELIAAPETPLTALAAPVSPVLIRREAMRLAHRHSTSKLVLRRSYVQIATVTLLEGEVRVEVARSYGNHDIPSIQYQSVCEPVDLRLLAAGRITTAELHPLVRAALSLPEGPRPAADSTEGVHRVRCRGEWHVVEERNGTIVIVEHAEDEAQREAALQALGGTVSGCFAVASAWRGGPGRLPRRLRERRRDVEIQLQHATAQEVIALLDEGLNPGLRDGRGWTLLHHLRRWDHTDLLARLLEAGLNINERASAGRTPLHVAVGDGGTVELVRALLAAGADPNLADDYGQTPRDLAAYKGGPYVGDDQDDPVARWGNIRAIYQVLKSA